MWKLKSKGKNVSVGKDQLTRLLCEETTKASKSCPDVDIITDTLCEMLQGNSIISRMRIAELLHMGIHIGMQYEKFLNINKAEYEPEDEA